MQDGASLGAGQAGGDIDEAPAQGRAPGNAVGFAGEDSGGAQQVVGDLTFITREAFLGL